MEILDRNIKNIEQYKEKQNELRNRIRFCNQHSFIEEVRIARIELDAMDMILFEYKNMYDEIIELLNN